MAETLKQIQSVDPTDFESGGQRRQEFIDKLGHSLRDTGFLFVKTDGVDQDYLDKVYDTFGSLFALDEDSKRQYQHPELMYQRGYTPPFQEVGIQCRASGPNGAAQPDAKENWFLGPELDSERLRQFSQTDGYREIYAENIWPDEVPEFAEAAMDMRHRLVNFGRNVLTAVGEYLDYPEGYFEEMTEDSPTVLRPLHYPVLDQEMRQKTVWGCDHTDINLVTALPPSRGSGLQVKTRDGLWVPGKAPEGHAIFQVGDMLEYITNGHLMSAEHKVVAPDKQITPDARGLGRLSAALFIHARSDVQLTPDARFTEADKAPNPTITAHDHLLGRLRDISLAKKSDD